MVNILFQGVKSSITKQILNLKENPHTQTLGVGVSVSTSN